MSLKEAYQKHDVRTLVIVQLETMGLKPPHAPDSPAYEGLCELYVADLMGFSAAVLEAGMRAWRRQWRYKSWPNVADLLPFFFEEANAEKLRCQPKRAELTLGPRMDIDEMRQRNDHYDREVLGIEPLGKLASQSTKAERRAYFARVDAAMKRLGLDKFKRLSDIEAEA